VTLFWFGRSAEDMDLENRPEENTSVLSQVKPSWEPFSAFGKADADFLGERPDVIEEGRCCSTCPEYPLVFSRSHVSALGLTIRVPVL